MSPARPWKSANAGGSVKWAARLDYLEQRRPGTSKSTSPLVGDRVSLTARGARPSALFTCLIVCAPYLLACVKGQQLGTTVGPRTADMSATFKYFAYGSNLLAQRIRYKNPSAKRSGVGQLAGWRLDFGEYESKRWGGHVATIVPDEAATVWGAIWDVGLDNLADLDRQEGVDQNVYRVVELSVVTPGGQIVKCRSYCLVNQPGAARADGMPSYLPSKVYLDTIVRGAKETGLPSDYVAKLEAIPHNGFDGPANLEV